MELQQSPPYARFVERLGWTVIRHKETNIFIRKFPIIGAFAKIQRVETLPAFDVLLPLLKKQRVRIVTIEPAQTVDTRTLTAWHTKLGSHFKLTKTPYLPTKTIIVDVTPEPEEIFRRFTEAKRRAVRRAIKNGVVCAESPDINAFIRLKNKSAGFLGSITTTGLRELWQVFAPQRATILFAYHTKEMDKPIAGILLVFWEDTAYYWIAAATKEGKKSFAPSLLVWEALKRAKNRGMKAFDFVGVWDDRHARQNREWLGFTKFKEGFGGKALYYPIASS